MLEVDKKKHKKTYTMLLTQTKNCKYKNCVMSHNGTKINYN